MPSKTRDRSPPLMLVSSPATANAGARLNAGGSREAKIREIDWSILMARAQGGDSTAYRRLLDEITPYLRAFARRRLDAADAEDVAQDVLLTLHAIRHTYDPRRPFGPWLVAIAQRRLADRLRRLGRRRSRETALRPEHESLSAPAANQEYSPDRRALQQALTHLSPGQQRAIRLLKIEDMSLKEAALASGASVASLKVATHRALASLRKLLAGRGTKG